MERSTSRVSGKFKKIIWQSSDARTLIVSFYIEKNDNVYPAITNKYNSISVTFKDNLFMDLKLKLEDESYELSLIKNNFSKYNNSYSIDLNSKILIVNNNEENEKTNLDYLIKVLKLPIFRKLVDSNARLLVKELGEDIFKALSQKNNLHGINFGIEELVWNDFIKIVKEEYGYIMDIATLFKIDVSYHFCIQMNKTFDSFNEFLDEYRDNFFQYYFDADEDKKVRISDLVKIAKAYNQECLKYKDSTYLYHFIQEYFFTTGNTRIEADLLYEILTKNIFDTELVRDLKKFNKAKDILLEKLYLVKLQYNDSLYYTTRDIIYMEKYVVNRLFDIAFYTSNELSYEHRKKSSINFDKMQAQAIKVAMEDNLVLITGHPGTGKTLITNEIINNFLDYYDEHEIAVLTPTGKATININVKQNNIKAQTIHSFLQWDADDNKFYINERNAEQIKCLIIDEFSMVSLELFYNLLRGISKRTLKKIILVGDKDQLPAIGSGYLIKDLVESNIVKTIFLNKIYRQLNNYEIINDALTINEGKFPAFEAKNSQFIAIEREELKKELIKKLDSLLESGYSKKEIAILSPMYSYETGIDELNKELNAYFRTKEKQEIINYREKNLAIGDKVINLVNDSKQNVFNGEIGYISHFIFAQGKNKDEKILNSIVVNFENDDKNITYSRLNFFKNTYPAYCTSVHKYQGSETKAVIVVLFSEAKRLLSKKLIYTAITRAKQYSVILGEKEALEYGIKNDSDSQRITNIKYLWDKKKGENTWN